MASNRTNGPTRKLEDQHADEDRPPEDEDATGGEDEDATGEEQPAKDEVKTVTGDEQPPGEEDKTFTGHVEHEEPPSLSAGASAGGELVPAKTSHMQRASSRHKLLGHAAEANVANSEPTLPSKTSGAHCRGSGPT